MTTFTWIPAPTGHFNVRHGALVRMTLRDGYTGDTISQEDVDALLIDAQRTQWSFIYNQHAYSGGVAWRHPITGQALRPKITYEVRPDDILAPNQLCDCHTCKEEP